MITNFDGKNFATSYVVGCIDFDENDFIASCETDVIDRLGFTKDEASLLLYADQEINGWLLKDVLETEI